MGEVVPFLDAKDRDIERLIIALHMAGEAINTFSEMYLRSSLGERVELGNPQDLEHAMWDIEKLLKELREKGYGKRLANQADA